MVPKQMYMKKVYEITKLIENNYKRSKIYTISLRGDYLTLDATFSSCGKEPLVALRILNKYPEISVVHFTGGFIDGVYTRETLSYGGYKVKENKEE